MASTISGAPSINFGGLLPAKATGIPMPLNSTNMSINQLSNQGVNKTTTPLLSPTQQSNNVQGTIAGGNVSMNPTNTATTTGFTADPKTGLPIGVQAVSPTHNLSGASGSWLSPDQQTTKPPTTAIDYSLHNGESIDAYKTRIAAVQQSTNNPQAPVNTAGTSQGLGTGGGQAPMGMEYGPNGQLQPITAAPVVASTQGGTTQSQQPYTVNNGLYGQLITGLANKANQPSADYTAQQTAANATLDQIKQLQTNQATQIANIEGSPIDLSLATGQEGILNRLASAKQAALSGQYQAQTNLLSAANTQQGLQQSGLNQAAGLVQPQLGQYGQAQYSPLGGTVGGGTGAGVSQNDPFYQTMQTYAQALATGQGTAIPGSISGNPALQAQLLQMAKQINPNFNYNQSTATGQSQQAQTGQAQQYQSAAQQAQNLGLQLQQVVTQAGINPNDINALNTFIQKIAKNTSDPNYPTFQNLISDLANTYAQVLTPAGGAVTDKVRDISSSLLNSTQSGQSILQVMKNLDAQVQAKIAGTQTAYGTTNNTNAGGGTANFNW